MNPEIIGIVAGLFTNIAPIPQIIKILRTKSANDISLTFLLILLLGLSLWLTYGVSINSFSIVVWNIIAILGNFFLVILWFLYRKKK